MKKLLTVLLAVFVMTALLLSFSSCKNYGYVNQALKKAEGWDAVDFDIKTDVHVTAGDKKEELSSEYSAKIQYIHSLDPVTAAKTRVTLYGETVPADVYHTNGSYYVLTNNDAVKLKNGNLIEGAGFIVDWKNMLSAIPNSAVKTAEERDNGDDTKTATIPVEEDFFETVYRNAIDSWHKKLVEQYANCTSASVVRVTNPTVAVTVNSKTGVLVSYTGKCTLNITAEVSSGVMTEISATFDQTLSCNGNGKSVTIELPEDYEDYKLSDGVKLDSNKILSNAIAGAVTRSEMDASLYVTLGAETVSSKNIKAKGINTEAWIFAWDEISVLKDKQVKNEVYYENGWYYTNVYGELAHLKYERSPETDAAYGYEDEILSLLNALGESDFKSATASSNEDGTRTFTITLTSSRFLKTQEGLLIDAKKRLESDGTVTVSDAAVEMIVDKKGVLKKYTVSFALSAKEGEDNIPVDFSYSLVYNASEAPVEVTPLLGYETFFPALERKQEFFGDVNKAIEKILGADSLNAYIFYSQYANVGKSFFRIDKQQESVTAAVDMKTNPKHFTAFTITENGLPYKEEVYCEDGSFYIRSDMSDSVKETEENLTEQNVFWMIYMMQTLPEKYFEKMSVVTENGNTVLSVSLSIEELQELFPDVAESLGINFVLPMMSYQYVKESRLAVTLNENNELVSYEVKLVADFGIDFTGKKYDGEAALEIYYEFNTDRSDISITPPDGYKDFPEAEW